MTDNDTRSFNPEAVDIEWLNPEFYLPRIAPDLVGKHDSTELSGLQRAAYNMVRYSNSPNPEDSMSRTMNGWVFNPETGRPFTLEELDVDRSKCVGHTVSASGRYPMVADVAVRMYRRFHPTEQE